MITLKNDFLTVQINEKGAELTSVIDNDEHFEYMWQGNKETWNRHAPVLFPIVGRLQDDSYEDENQHYHMTQHGFARDYDFVVESQTDSKVVLSLADSAETRKIYPFEFKLTMMFELDDHALMVSNTVANQSARELLFSIGNHPGFNVPMANSTTDFADYNLMFSPKKVYKTIPLVGPFSDLTNPGELELKRPLPLTHNLFEHDAQILKLDGEETTVMLSTTANDHGVALTVQNAPYLGIWSTYPTEGAFVCIEPWWGIADTVNANGQLAHKADIRKLAIGQEETFTYQISYF
ncbi:aldose 1-epimerase family protein [Secundilactobacillus malefermentans]|uniref:Aldose 1-epimerase n=1 Tax=Secundilactobacillus malefermentans TaxID=176292 RepID=A0A4R5NMU5_9LACO|nr:aldose 1-epimerase family protein [Secundilactobacillus malefermentans]QEA32361.1 aldose 1-epimerase family protein [Secundilactobacillus malefermentans]TDG76245.1 hypothetical protein C5L31_000858 [Secundilactobacillus malefermentans]